MLRAAIFDLDGLMLDSEPLWQQAERAAFGAVGVRLDDEDLCRTIGMRVDEVARFWFERRPWDRDRHPLDTVVEAISDHVIECIGRGAQPLPGVADAVTMLRRRGLVLAVASSSPLRIIEAALAALRLREAFAVVVSAEGEPRGKPDPAVYLAAARRLGLSPSSCFALEDSVAGLQAAQAAGMRCVVVAEPRQRHRHELDRADVRLESLEAFDDGTLTALGGVADVEPGGP